MKRIAIIPARGGSKRIPGKNVRLFHGKPIIAYSIECAFASGLFDAVMVSTDSDEVAAVAQAAGATFWRRPAELADDHTGTQAVMRHALAAMGDLTGTLACCIYPTAPMMTVADLEKGLHHMTHGNWAYAFSITTYDFPVQRALFMLEGGGMEPWIHAHMETRSQDLRTFWHDAGMWYWGRASAFMRDEPIYGPASVGIPIPRHRVQDIDEEGDWIRAEFMYQAWKLQEAGCSI